MQQTAHIIDFYSHMTAEVMAGRVHYAKLPKFTRAHDRYLLEHDRSVSAHVAARAYGTPIPSETIVGAMPIND
jgi:hypothetical protein